MTRYLVVINIEADRERVQRYIKAAPWGTRVELKAPRRSLPQNDRMWAMLSDIAVQKEHSGRKYTPDQWKIIFLAACGREVQFIPGLDGKTFLPWGQSSSDLSREEMTDLIEFMFQWGAENDVIFHDQREAVE